MIKAVLFDYGGVLTEGGKQGGIPETLGSIYGLNPEAIRITDLHDQLIVGKISPEAFFAETNRRYGAHTQADVGLFNAHNDHFIAPSQPVYDLAAKLRKTGIRTAVLSNVYPFSAAQLRQEGLYKGFDPIILSCEEGLAKPDPAFFELALRRLGLSGEEILYIEDQERFMPPGRLGMHTVLAVSPQQIVDDICAVIQKENDIKLQ